MDEPSELIDIGANLTHDSFDPDRDSVIARAVAAGVVQIVVTGATASLRGGARFAAFAQAKAAQRSLAQSIAREAGPAGVHVSLVIVDGLVDTPMVRERFPNAPEEKKLKPEAIAESVWFLAHQDPSAWTFELDLRPSHERW